MSWAAWHAACRSGKALKRRRAPTYSRGSGPSIARRSGPLQSRSGSSIHTLKILFIGDIVGSPGRKIVHERLADILAQRAVDLCIANGENSASGFGITPRIAAGSLRTTAWR